MVICQLSEKAAIIGGSMTIRKEREGRFFGTREALDVDMKAWWHTQDENFVVVQWMSLKASTPRREILWYVVSDEDDHMKFAGVEFASVLLHYTIPTKESAMYILSRCRWYQHAIKESK